MVAANPNTARSGDAPFFREDGYWNATELCRKYHKSWDDYLHDLDTSPFLMELWVATGIDVWELVDTHHPPIVWVHGRVGIHLRMWCSPDFALLVTGWIDELFHNGRVEYLPDPPSPQRSPSVHQLISDFCADAAKRPKRKKQRSVYLFRLNDFHKIGSSGNPTKRLAAVIPCGLGELVHSFPSESAFAVEKALHARFDGCRVEGQTEWFRLSDEDVRSLSAIERADAVSDLPTDLQPPRRAPDA